MDMDYFEKDFETEMLQRATSDDPAHDILHFKRVVKIAKEICFEEGARTEVVIPAAWLHDFIVVPKDDPRRKQASRLSAEGAKKFLIQIKYPEEYLDDICHAIEAHSFSAQIAARTKEAQIVQDADRLDGLGAIGIARCFTVAALMKRSFYSELDPLCEVRSFDDSKFTIDHFFAKLFKTVDLLQTNAGKAEGIRRADIMRAYLKDLKQEI